jgi:hypothetical protein
MISSASTRPPPSHSEPGTAALLPPPPSLASLALPSVAYAPAKRPVRCAGRHVRCAGRQPPRRLHLHQHSLAIRTVAIAAAAITTVAITAAAITAAAITAAAITAGLMPGPLSRPLPPSLSPLTPLHSLDPLMQASRKSVGALTESGGARSVAACHVLKPLHAHQHAG